MKIPRLPKKEEVKTKKLSIREAMAAGWQLFRTKFWTCFWMLVLASFVVSVPSLLTWFSCIYFRQGAMLNLILYVIAPAAIITVVSVVSLGTLNVLLRILDDQDVSVPHLFSKSGKLIVFLIAAILYGLASSLGLVFFFFPGIMIMLAFQFYPFFIVDHDTGPLQALKASRAITAGARWKLFFLAMILGLIQGLSVLLLWWTIVAPFLVMIYAFLTYTCAYRLMLLNTPAEKLPFTFYYTPPVEEATGKQISGDSTANGDFGGRQGDPENLATQEALRGAPGELSIADRAERMDLEIANMIARQSEGEKLDIARKKAAQAQASAPRSTEHRNPLERTEQGERAVVPETDTPAEQMEPINQESQEAKDELS